MPTKKGFPVYNVGMSDENDHHLTYIHLGIMASILLNSKAVDFVVTGCGTGQGALMSLNIHPGVVCGYCIDPADAFLFAQINNGNALSLPFAKGFGWGAELNVRFIFEKAFTGRNGEGYPPERKEPQVRNAGILNQVKAAVVKRTTSIPLRAIDPQLVKTAVSAHASSSASSKTARIKQSKTLFARSSLNRHQGQRRWHFRRYFSSISSSPTRCCRPFWPDAGCRSSYQTDQGDKHKRQAEALIPGSSVKMQPVADLLAQANANRPERDPQPYRQLRRGTEQRISITHLRGGDIGEGQRAYTGKLD